MYRSTANGPFQKRRERRTAPDRWCCPRLRWRSLLSSRALATNPYIFAGRGDGPYRGFSQAKTAFDSKLPDIAPWVIHDLRRTAVH